MAHETRALLDDRIPHTVDKLSGMRKTIARRLAQSMQQAPHIYLTVDIQLDRLRARLTDRKINVVLTDAAKTHLVRTGYDPNYGARPLKRTIQREVETALSRMMLRGEVRDGMTIEVDYDDSRDALTFKPVVEAEVVG